MKKVRSAVSRAVVTTVLVASTSGWLAPGTAAAADRFFTYRGTTPLSSYVPGAVLKTRTLPHHVAGIAAPVDAVQILYRTTNAAGKPVANVTSVLKPRGPSKGLVSYQSIYDSLNPEDGPSRAVAGDFRLIDATPQGLSPGRVVANAENVLLPLLLAGYTVNVADIQGPAADFAAGPEYGMTTLDSLRATSQVSQTGTNSQTPIALIGYSGGAIGTGWAAILANSYAPDIGKRLVGATEGGVLVNPVRNLRYLSGSLFWSGVGAMAVTGLIRAYGIDFNKYASAYGRTLINQLQNTSITNVVLPFLRWQQLVKPQYADPASIPELVTAGRKINMGTAPVPSIPMLIAQGANGILNGTPPGGPGIGAGDGVMISGDVRALAKRYCDNGIPVTYRDYALLEHGTTAIPWLAESIGWLHNRFAGKPAPTNCSTIAPGTRDALKDPVLLPPKGFPARR